VLLGFINKNEELQAEYQRQLAEKQELISERD
jgi:hypothetical protein